LVAPYVPDNGDIVWLSFDPQKGHEQAGRRPFLVLTPRAYNERTSLIVGCPITSRAKGYPFEVGLSPENALQGVVLADQVKSLDWRERRAEFAEEAAEVTLRATRQLIKTLLNI
jgi:mRNA interferase MazF